MGEPLTDTDHFLPRGFRWYTLAVILFILGLGVVTAVSGLWNFLMLGVGESALYAVYQRKWKAVHRTVAPDLQAAAGTRTLSFGRYVLLAWAYAMLMEFCVDFGSYGTLNPGVVLLIMLVLTPHYLFMAAVFRLWFRWYTYSPREAYFTMGAVGFLLESIILKLFAGTFEWSGILLFPVDVPVHMLNYGGIVLIPTFYHNQTDRRTPVRTRKKFVVGVVGTLALTLPEIAATYWFVYGVILQ
ncbi:MAG TPA: hypothetical protein ENN81_01690 [Phycisphaerales bacterium]|nr:hypothetical protein [Phycisphaerales bacterium]